LDHNAATNTLIWSNKEHTATAHIGTSRAGFLSVGQPRFLVSPAVGSDLKPACAWPHLPVNLLPEAQLADIEVE
jgi:hypothetical protein